MRFTSDKQQMVKDYILEKIIQKSPSVAKTVADTLGINTATVHAYINELLEEKIIAKKKRNVYELVESRYTYDLNRSNGDLDDDIDAYNKCLDAHIQNLSDNVRNIWGYTFTEMINNVMDHSAAENASIAVSQNYMTTSVTITDNGIGIFNKIQDYMKLPSIDDAICELFKGKLTTDSVNHSGEGIFFSSKLMDDFYILSSGKIFTNNKFDDIQISDDAQKTTGTCVFMSLSNFSHKEAKDIFDEYADVDGGFTKTRIPLKNIFNTSPVSRSQAKRMCNRLDKFEEVIIDFEGIEWMGQGFAHQVFAVFADSNPGISIKPVNMNESVAKMYRHVLSGI